MIYGEQQQKEIATIKERNFKLQLSDADVDRLALKAAEASMTMEELLTSFIGDLVGGTYTNGSDECMYAESWYERCGFSYFPTTDIARLANACALETMVDSCKEYQDAVETLADTKEFCGNPESDDYDEEEVQRAEEYFAECKEEVEDTMKFAKCEGTLEEVVAAVLAWNEKVQQVKK